jgi:hypothetical protein
MATGEVDRVVPLNEIGNVLMRLVADRDTAVSAEPLAGPRPS